MNRKKYPGRVVTRAPAVHFKDVHPGPGAGRPMENGEDLLLAGGNESRWIRCKQCGFAIDREVTSPGSPYGNDPEGRAGCPFCKSDNYDPSLPEQYSVPKT